MATKLEDAHLKMTKLLDALNTAQQTYLHTREMLNQHESGAGIDPSAINLRLEIGGLSIPLPPGNIDQVGNHLETAINLLGQDINRLWSEVLAVAQGAVEHCAAAAQRASQPAAQQPMPQMPPVSPPLVSMVPSNYPLTPPGQQPVVVQGTPLTTVPLK